MFMKSVLQRTFHLLGGLAFVRNRHRGRSRILMYHNFPGVPETAAAFDEQCRHLATHYKPVSMSEIALAMKTGRQLPPNAVAVTVDDGYRDFYVTAWPVLQRYAIPATVYLMTDFIDGCTWPWWDQLQFAIENTRRESMHIDPIQPLGLRSSGERLLAYQRTAQYLKTIPNQSRLRFMAELPSLLNVELPSRPPAGLEPLSWAEIRKLAENGIEFGAHTKTHPILSRLETDAKVREEVTGSRDRLAEELGKKPVHFCYPNGLGDDISTRDRAIVESCGFETSVTAYQGLNDSTADRFMLRRIPCEPRDSTYYFRQQAAGFRM
jgi:peptidoglycan/xylan/chitin deacetylase (PgdA/CDA1 family)